MMLSPDQAFPSLVDIYEAGSWSLISNMTIHLLNDPTI